MKIEIENRDQNKRNFEEFKKKKINRNKHQTKK